jgi:beta-D-galactosyl-(1->4)-L-rhamnose phosphorylase
MKFEHTSGGFTLPGESGQEKLTLELAEKWGADVIRDSDGTKLSDEILDAGYDIYSTLCIIRDHNEWAKQHPECLQQSFLSTDPVIAAEGPLTVRPMAGFFAEQFRINDRPEAMRYWQVWDRTADKPLPAGAWRWDASAGTVTVAEPVPFHAYTVSFLAWRLWEEINMYNHVTNHWTSEHLLPVDPRTAEAQDYLYSWLQAWCESHPQTNVVRFTSMFYNFVWIWGSDDRNRNLFTDWGSYDFTVSEKALDDFAAAYGYALTAEDFINKGSLQVTHMPPTAHKRDYMEFTQQFVAGFGKKLVDLVHRYGKRAYVFYDDSWVGVEPYGPHFKEFGFDGIIKCVFSGYEARMCAGVDAPVHELRLHPYLFPVGLGGAPTFAPGGNPTHDAAAYWNHVRRAGGVIIGKGVCVGCEQGAVLRGCQWCKGRCRRPCGGIGHRQTHSLTESTGHKSGHPVGTKVVCVGVIAGVEPPFGGFQSLLSDQLHGVGVQVQRGDSFFFP